MTVAEIIQAQEEGCRFTVDGWGGGIAFYFAGAQTEFVEVWDDDFGPDVEERATGMVHMVMVGDDYRHVVDPEDLTVIGEMDYCACCGQVGCTWDGRERDG